MRQKKSIVWFRLISKSVNLLPFRIQYIDQICHVEKSVTEFQSIALSEMNLQNFLIEMLSHLHD